MNRTHKFRQGMLLALAMFTAVLVFVAPQRCADALHAGLVLCGGPLLVSLFPFLIVSALLMGCGAGPLLGFAFQPAARVIGVRAKAAGSVLLIGFLGGFAPAAAAAAQAVRTGQLTPRQTSALLPACVCSGPSFVILTVGEQMLGSRALGGAVVCGPAAGGVSYGCGALPDAGRCRAVPARKGREDPTAHSGCRGGAGSGHVPETVRLCAVFPAAGGGSEGFAAKTVVGAAHDAAGGLLRLRLRVPHRTVGQHPLLCSPQRAGSLGALQVRTICPPEVSLGPLLAARVLHLPLSLALFWLVVPGTEQAVQAFSTLSGRVAVMHRVPLDCALLAFAVCCITVAELQKRCSGQCEALHDQHKKTAAR